MLVPEEQNMTRTEQPDAPKQIAIKHLWIKPPNKKVNLIIYNQITIAAFHIKKPIVKPGNPEEASINTRNTKTIKNRREADF